MQDAPLDHPGLDQGDERPCPCTRGAGGRIEDKVAQAGPVAVTRDIHGGKYLAFVDADQNGGCGIGGDGQVVRYA